METASLNNGEFYIDLHGGEVLDLSLFPTGTSYSVYEESSDGWILINQSNTAGIVSNNEMKIASFEN